MPFQLYIITNYPWYMMYLLCDVKYQESKKGKETEDLEECNDHGLAKWLAQANRPSESTFQNLWHGSVQCCLTEWSHSDPYSTSPHPGHHRWWWWLHHIIKWGAPYKTIFPGFDMVARAQHQRRARQCAQCHGLAPRCLWRWWGHEHTAGCADCKAEVWHWCVH